MHSDSHAIEGYRLLRVVADCLARLIEPGNCDEQLTDLLARLGPAVNADRVYVFENHETNGTLFCSQRSEWAREGVTAQILNPDLQNIPFEKELPDLYPKLSNGQPFLGIVREFGDSLRAMLEKQEIKSIVLVPFFTAGTFSGFVGFDDCHFERNWAEAELDLLRAVAAGIGSALHRERVELSLTNRADELARSRRVALSLMEDSQRAVRAAEEASRAKSAFLAMMSHEIRTPLNGVIGFTDLLLAEKLPADQAEIVETIRSCGNSLLGLISDILDLSKVESGRIELDLTTCSPADSVREVIQTFGTAIRAKHLEVTAEISPAVPDKLVTDFKRLRQILINLIGNAVKFTDQGRVTVSLNVVEQGEHGLTLVCRVADTGIGISHEEQLIIFDAFSQAHASIHRKFGGSGLGLTISRKLARAMGGEITVNSAPGKGTTFEFVIPVRRPAPTGPLIQPSEAAKSSPDPRLKILVVDDIGTNIRLTLAILRRLGCDADTAGDGLEAVEMAKKTAYDIIFMDILMPRCDGIEAASLIRKFEKKNPGRTPARIIALTADAFPENRGRCLKAGMDDFLTKPLRIDTIQIALLKTRSTAR